MRIISIPQRRVGNLLGPSGQHIKSLQVGGLDGWPGKAGRAESGLCSRAGPAACRWTWPRGARGCARVQRPLTTPCAAHPLVATHLSQEVLRVKIGVADPVDRSGNRHVTLWGAPQNVRVAADVVMLAAGSLPQELEAGARSSRSSSRGDDDSSVAGSVATTELVCC